MSVFRVGFLPLVDAALPIIAAEYGLAEREGVRIELHKDRTWAAVRDRLAYGQTDAAHMIAPLAIAMNLGLDRPPVAVASPFVLGLNGNTVTLAKGVADSLGIGSLTGDTGDIGRRLAAFAKQRAASGSKLRLAVVHRYSSHNYMLRYWLAACGCDPDRDVEIDVVPPPFVAEAFAAGEIDGSCVGEPWNSVAVENGNAVIVATTSQIWSRGVEKLLAFPVTVLDQRRGEVEALLRALHAAGGVAVDPALRTEVAALLAGSISRPARRPDRTGAVRNTGRARWRASSADCRFLGAAWRSRQLPVAQSGDVALFSDGALGPRAGQC
jgi:two-component system, oxyanion-binding sensor